MEEHLDHIQITEETSAWSDPCEEVASEFHRACFSCHSGMPVAIYVNGEMKYATDH